MSLFAEKRILSVSQLTALIRGVLEENFEHVWVEGEVSNLAMPSSGHLYFTLKDAGAQLRCVMFRASARALRFQLKDGVGLIVRGRLSLYDQRGEYQLIVEYLEPKGVGALQLAFTQLKERLAREGLFAESHKKALPLLPQRIGIVTSPTGAAIHDILTILQRRYANVEVLLCPVKVQGEGAAQEIADAIRALNRYREIDVIIVGRGGGSLEDLWAFNEEVVAQAIYHSKIPIISAVGHEIDFTIADLVADMRAPTPSAAAELVVKSKDELSANCEALEHRLRQGMRQRLTLALGKLEGECRALKDPVMLLGHLGQRVDDLQGRLLQSVQVSRQRRRERLTYLTAGLRQQHPQVQIERGRELLLSAQLRSEHGMRRILESCRESQAVQGGRLHALSPLLTLSRGYTVVQKEPQGCMVKSSRELRAGDRLLLRFFEGSAHCTVQDVASPGDESQDWAAGKP